ncbi:hypothetical protein GCM10009534_34410 [Kribbella sandramycini]
MLPESARDKDELQAYARGMVACMNRAWDPVMKRAKARFWPVTSVYAYDLRKPTAECGLPAANMAAFYRDGLICFEWKKFADGEPMRDLVDLEQLIAHEYGHHVQNLAGILQANRARKAPSKAVELENERRKELQASCLGAAFLGANRVAFKLTGRRLATWKSIVRHVGDENNTLKIRDHGSYKSHAYWTIPAFAAASPGACNTFTAAPKRVS